MNDWSEAPIPSLREIAVGLGAFKTWTFIRWMEDGLLAAILPLWHFYLED